MQVGYRQKSRFWSNSWLSKIAGRAKCQNIYRRRSWVYDTVGHEPLAIDRLLDVRTTKWQKQLPTTMQCRSHGRDAPANICLWRPAAWTNTPKRREQKIILLYAVVYLKPKQLIIKDCGRRFVLKIYRHEARAASLRQQSFLLKVCRCLLKLQLAKVGAFFETQRVTSLFWISISLRPKRNQRLKFGLSPELR